jgi:hypothetical protein
MSTKGGWGDCSHCEDGYSMIINYMGEEYSFPQQVCKKNNDSLRRLENCVVSDGEDESVCMACAFGFFFDQEADSCNICSGKFENCGECSFEECEKCEDGFEMIDGLCKRPCSKTVKHCGECSSNDSELCEKCENNLKLKSTSDGQACDCPTQSYLIVSDGKPMCSACSAMIDNCLSCNIDGSECEECTHKFERDSEGQCVIRSIIKDASECVEGKECFLSCSKGFIHDYEHKECVQKC